MLKRILFVAAAIGMPAGGTVVANPELASGSDPYFVPLSPMRVPIIDGREMTGVLTVDLVLKTVDAAAANRLRASVPQLRAASVATTTEFAHLYSSGLTPVDVSELSTGLTQVLTRESADIAGVLVVKVAASPA